MLRAWPRYASLSMGLVPVLMFAGMMTVIVVKTLPAFEEYGLSELLGDRFASIYTTGEGVYGLLPALWGTVMVTAIALMIAVPVSLALATVATEFQLGPVGRSVNFILGILAGIPSVVYAVLAVVFVTEFMIPKFAADSTFGAFTPQSIGADPATWPPSDVPYNAGAWPWDLTGRNNSVLLGGILIALLVIPFMAPLIADAFRNVASGPKEASLALGANRWHTLRRVVLPHALPGVLAGVSLGALKALGDTMIVTFVIGFEAVSVPDPVFDPLERTAPLTSTGAGLLGGFQGSGQSCASSTSVGLVDGVLTEITQGGGQCGVGYFSALLLFGMAVLIVIAASIGQQVLRRRLQA